MNSRNSSSDCALTTHLLTPTDHRLPPRGCMRLPPPLCAIRMNGPGFLPPESDLFPPGRRDMCGFLVSMRMGTRRLRRLAAAVLTAGFLVAVGLGAAATPALAAESAPAATSVPALVAHASLASTYPAAGSVVPKQPE